jgi:tRNA A37 methylthiotransferase MiaB
MALEADFLPDGVGTERLEELLEVQRGISADRLARSIGGTVEAIVDECGDDAVARTWGQADDVDGVTILVNAAHLPAGTLVEARILDADDYDLRATPLEIVREATAVGDGSGRVGSGRRSLPVLPMGLEAAWGR